MDKDCYTDDDENDDCVFDSRFAPIVVHSLVGICRLEIS